MGGKRTECNETEWLNSPRVRQMVPLVGGSMSVYYVLHISFMWFVKFDYGYNMKVGGGSAKASVDSTLGF